MTAYTTSEASIAVGIPKGTMRGWVDRQILRSVNPTRQRGSWCTFSEAEVLQIAVIAALTRVGVPPALASTVVECNWHDAIVDDRLPSPALLCVARIDDLFGFTVLPDLAAVSLPSSWFFQDGALYRWLVTWHGEDGKPAHTTPDFCIPQCVTVIDMGLVRKAVVKRLRRF